MSGVILSLVGAAYSNLPSIGSALGGGFFAGQIDQSGTIYNLVVGPAASTQTVLAWKNAATATPGSDSDIDGPQNTADMVADGNSTVYPSAHFCNDLTTGGQTDWYMPSKNELEVCYYNLKPTTTANDTNSGINPNAVPARASNYTSGNPAQTSAADFQTAGGAEAFAASTYATSTEFSATQIWRSSFIDGLTGNGNKTYGRYIRAVRRIAV